MCENKDKIINDRLIHSNEIKPEKENLLKQYYNEWSITNQYVNDLDKGQSQNIGIFISISTVALSIAALIGNKNTSFDFSFLFFIMPIAFLISFGFLGYQFRITAILRGHLARIEKEMNDLIGENVYMWNSALTETYMRRRNVSNKLLMVPIFFFVIVYSAFCVKETFNSDITKEYGIWLFITYWVIVVICALIVLIPFFKNDAVRWKTYDTTDVMKKYIKAAVINSMGKKIANKHIIHKNCDVVFEENENRYDISIICVLKEKYRNNKEEYDNLITESVHNILPVKCDSEIKIQYVE